MSETEQNLDPAAAPKRRRRRRRKAGGLAAATTEPTLAQPVGAPVTRPNRPPKQGQGPGRGPQRGQQRRGARPGTQPAGPADYGEVPAGERATYGFLELNGANGVLRPDALASREDAQVPAQMVRALGLRVGDLVAGTANGRNLVRAETVNGHGLEGLAERPRFEKLTAVHPDTALVLGPTEKHITGRLLDLIAPVGRGQRGLIVAPPKAGKTTILKDIASGLAADPEVTLIAVLIGERPEEVTELRREIHGMVLAADLDRPPTDHTRVAELGVEHAKRLVEEGRHVVFLVDSLTRLARAYNLGLRGGSGRTMSGGMDAEALQPVRRVFGAARCAEEGGSLTILATTLVDTGSRLDDLVYEEFKGTGNMEVHLDRKLAEKRLFPAVNIDRSGTRREELLLDPATLAKVTTIRRKLAGQPPDVALEALLNALRKQAAAEAAAEAAAAADPGA